MSIGRQLSLTCPQWPLRLQSQASPRCSSLGSWARAQHIAELLAVGVAALSRQAVVLTSSLDRRGLHAGVWWTNLGSRPSTEAGQTGCLLWLRGQGAGHD